MEIPRCPGRWLCQGWRVFLGSVTPGIPSTGWGRSRHVLRQIAQVSSHPDQHNTLPSSRASGNGLSLTWRLVDRDKNVRIQARLEPCRVTPGERMNRRDGLEVWLRMRGKRSNEECEGWDSNPRTPARPGPEPGAVDLAWLPSRQYRFGRRKDKYWRIATPNPSGCSRSGT